jgi:hypothetical protein
MAYEFDGRYAAAAMVGPVPDRDWLKNIVAAGHARMQRYGRTLDLTDPRVLPKAEAAPFVKGAWRPIFARLPFEQAVLLTRTN